MPVVWERLNDIATSHEKIPSIVRSSQKNFRPPETIASDFKRYLEHDVPNVNYTFEQIRDWNIIEDDGYEPVYIRAQYVPIDWKSKVGNSDMNYNFKTSHDVMIRKGDIVIREDGKILCFSWNIQNHPNNQATQATECNTWFTIMRNQPEIVDKNGYVLQEAYKDVIVPRMPGIHIEYAGRPDYAASQGQPGINPDHLITCSLQWNEKTQKVEINDEFMIGDFTYRIVNISLVEVDINREYGMLVLNARRVAGGEYREIEW